MAELKVVSVSRKVIEGQVLAALDDKSKVACIFSKEDLTVLIDALKGAPNTTEELNDRGNEMLADLCKLRVAAFGD